MSERWVCKRCFADNDGQQGACARCGLIRGAESTGTDQAAWTSPGGPATPGRRPAWHGLLRFWWVPVVAIPVLVGFLQNARRGDDGSLTSAGTVAVQELRIGDCFNSAAESEITEVDGVPCTEAHEFEVFEVGEHGASGDPYPTDAEMDAAFAAVCEPAFEPYVGAPWATSEIYANMITPSEESWDEGDREYTCVLVDPDDAALTESLRGAGR